MKPAALATIVLIIIAVGAQAADEPPRLNFALEDQFGETHTDQDCGGVVTILLGGGRKGVKYIDEWGPRMHRVFSGEFDDGKICSIGFAHLKGAPFFVHKKIIAGFPEDPTSWTLLDWKGHIAKSWGAEKNIANIYVFDRDGRLVFKAGLRDFDQAQLDRIIEATKEAAAER